MANNIAKYRKKAGLTQQQLAEMIGTTLNMMGKLERNDRTLNHRWLDKICAALSVTPTELLGANEVPIIGYVGAGGEVLFEDAYEQGDAMYAVESLPGLPSNLIGLEVRGDSMWPVIKDGQIVFISREGWDNVDDEALNDWAICRLTDGRTLLKEPRRATKPGRYDLISTNMPPIEDVELVWATPVIGWRRRR